jgi:uncharacterized protein
MPQPLVHFEIIGRDPARLRRFYTALFGWEFDTDWPIASMVSEAGNYGFTEGTKGEGVPAGVGGGAAFSPTVVVYIGVDDIDAYLAKAVELGGSRILDQTASPSGTLSIGKFADPEGNVIGLAALS